MTELDLRQAARGLVISDDRVVLVKWVFPSGVSAWGVPGGGLEAGEDPLDGLRRELGEELGLRDIEIGPPLWERTLIFPMMNGQEGQRDVAFLVEVEPFEIEPEIGWEALRDEWVSEIRWWTLDEIRASTERIVPSELPTIIDDLRRDGPPATPLILLEHGG